MTANNKLNGPGETRAFSPFLAPEERHELNQAIDFGAAPLPGFADAMRALARGYIDDGDSLKLRAILLLVADLAEQGWEVSSKAGAISFQPPGLTAKGEESIDDIKGRVRQALQVARRRQLAEPSVRAFLEGSERRRVRKDHGLSLIHI